MEINDKNCRIVCELHPDCQIIRFVRLWKYKRDVDIVDCDLDSLIINDSKVVRILIADWKVPTNSAYKLISYIADNF
jgi:hypothetical protein